jgi:hypothetical protein
MLEVVQHQQEALVAQKVQQARSVRPSRSRIVGQVKGARNG